MNVASGTDGNRAQTGRRRPLVAGAIVTVALGTSVAFLALRGSGAAVDPVAVAEIAARSRPAPDQLAAEITVGFATFVPAPGSAGGGLPVQITNNGTVVRFFDLTVRATAVDGTEIATSTSAVEGIAPGQAAVVTMFTDVAPERLAALANATFAVVELVGRRPSAG